MDVADTKSSSTRCIKTREEVDAYLKRVKICLNDESSWRINDEKWLGRRVNKTEAFLAEKNLSDDDVAAIIRELQVANYSYTDDDRNSRFPNELFWFFGMTHCIIDSEEKLYIKLKIREMQGEFLLVMSFHPEKPQNPADELTFPYAV